MTPAKAKRQKKKTKIWTKPAVLGLILGVLGAMGVIQLRPQLSVTPLDPLSTNEPFTAPFQITNNGYMNVHVDNVTVVHHLVQSGPPIVATFKDDSQSPDSWDDFDLARSGGSKTIFINFANFMPTKADMVIAVDYRFFWKSWRWFFRFDGVHMDRWAWTKQPVGDIEQSMDKIVNRALELHTESKARRHKT